MSCINTNIIITNIRKYLTLTLSVCPSLQDCLRHVDMALGSPVNNLVVAGKYASKRVFESDKMINKQTNGGFFGVLKSWLSYLHVLFRINSYEIMTRLSLTQ